MNRYRFFAVVAAALLLSAVKLHAQYSGELAQSEIQMIFEGSKGDISLCYRIPTLATTPNGDLIAAIDERHDSCGDLKWNRNINIAVRRSSDGGTTWSCAKTIVDYPDGQSASDPSIIVDHASGQIFLFFNFMDLDKQRDVYYHYVTVSNDNGVTWSTPRDITPEITLPEWGTDFRFISSGRGIVTSDGMLLHTLVNLQRGVTLFGSRDHGKSWQISGTLVNPADESQLIEARDGAIVMNSRVNGAGIRYIHTTTDGGKSWSSRADSALVDPGCNAALAKTAAGQWLFCNLNSAKERENLILRISSNQGESWPQTQTIYRGSSAYSSITILPDNSIGILFELDDYTKVGFVKLTTVK